MIVGTRNSGIKIATTAMTSPSISMIPQHIQLVGPLRPNLNGRPRRSTARTHDIVGIFRHLRLEVSRLGGGLLPGDRLSAKDRSADHAAQTNEPGHQPHGLMVADPLARQPGTTEDP